MENKSRSSLVILVLILAIVFAGLLSYYFYNKQTAQNASTDQSIAPAVEQSAEADNGGPKKGDLGYQEPQTKVEIGTQGVDKGTFVKVEGDNIFIKNGESQKQYPLTKDEIAVSCTSQDLAGATELDFNLVKEVKVATPATLGSMLPENEFVVVFAQNIQGVNTVHTVALDAAKCAAK